MVAEVIETQIKTSGDGLDSLRLGYDPKETLNSQHSTLDILVFKILAAQATVNSYAQFLPGISPKETRLLLAQIQRNLWAGLTAEQQNEVTNQLLLIQDLLEEDNVVAQYRERTTNNRVEYVLSDLVSAASVLYGEELFYILSTRANQFYKRYGRFNVDFDLRSIVISHLRDMFNGGASANEIAQLMQQVDMDKIVSLFLVSESYKAMVASQKEANMKSERKAAAENRWQEARQFAKKLFGKDGLRFGVRSVADVINSLYYIFNKNFSLVSGFKFVSAFVALAMLLSGCTGNPNSPLSTDDSDPRAIKLGDQEISLEHACGRYFAALLQTGVYSDEVFLRSVCQGIQFYPPEQYPDYGGFVLETPVYNPESGQMEISIAVQLMEGANIEALFHEIVHATRITNSPDSQGLITRISIQYTDDKNELIDKTEEYYVHSFEVDINGKRNVIYLISMIEENVPHATETENGLTNITFTSEPVNLYGNYAVVQKPCSEGDICELAIVDISNIEEAITDFTRIILLFIDKYGVENLSDVSEDEIVKQLEEYGYFVDFDIRTKAGDIDQRLIAGYVKFMLNNISDNYQNGTIDLNYLAQILENPNYKDSVAMFLVRLAEYSGAEFNQEFIDILVEMLKGPQYFATKQQCENLTAGDLPPRAAQLVPNGNVLDMNAILKALAATIRQFKQNLCPSPWR